MDREEAELKSNAEKVKGFPLSHPSWEVNVSHLIMMMMAKPHGQLVSGRAYLDVFIY